MSAAEAVWAFEPKPDESSDARVVQLTSMRFDGDEMIEGLRRNPTINLGKFTVDFNSDIWRFQDEGQDSLAPQTPPMSFRPGGEDDIWKLWVICSYLWGRYKTRTLSKILGSARHAFAQCAGDGGRTATISGEDYQRYAEFLSGKSGGYRYSSTRALVRFLEFREAFFGVPNDPTLMEALRRGMKKDGLSLSHSAGTPSIDDDYLVPLVEACKASMDGEDEPIRYRIAAAMILLATQIGMRISEARALETGQLYISSVVGKPDLTYLKFKTFKGARGDDGYREVESIINETALSAYLFLVDTCAEHRLRIGTNALIVTPEQRNAFPDKNRMALLMKEFIMAHHRQIPCIDTQGSFPDMQTTLVRRVAKPAKKKPEAFGLTGEETLVYPKFHSFRSTVATKLYEAGVDLRYIRRHMGHLDENTTISYIRSDQEIERSNNDLVYRAVLDDGAEFIGKHGSEFQQLVEQFVSNLPGHVKENLDEVVKETSRKYPLRRKVGGVCIRCAKMFPCPTDDETDQIYCAFGVCPNQCVLYFFADQCLDTVRSHMELVEINRQRGHTKAARNELRKAHNVIRDALVPELDSLDRQLAARGRDGVLGSFPELEQLIDTLPEVRKEIAEWQAMSI